MAGGSSLRALAVANARYWPTVAPEAQRELARWLEPARDIPDPDLRALAVAKLTHERFNAEVAATLATLAPSMNRGTAVRAIVALELLFDYLDGRTERPSADPIGEGERMFEPFVGALERPDANGALAVMRGWRAAKSARAFANGPHDDRAGIE